MQAGELCVCDIEDVIGGPQTKVSRHLAYLRRSGLVAARRKGLWMLYSVPETLTAPQKTVLSCVTDLLGQSGVAKGDSEKFRRNLRKGCCATFTSVLPDRVPVTIEIK